MIEKKDLNVYIQERIKTLRNEMKTAIIGARKSRREEIRERFKGRIWELEKLKRTINEGKLKRNVDRNIKGEDVE